MRGSRPARHFLLLACSILAIGLCTGPAQAQIPEEINYQGKLTQNNQLANGPYQFRFRIYDGAGMGANLLWTEVHPVVQVTNGQFEVSLGSEFGFDMAVPPLAFDIQYFLGIEVDNDGEMSPRKPFTSIGYALNAVHAQNADHSNMSDNATNANNAQNANNSQNSNRATRSDLSEGVKEDKVAMVMTALRGGGSPQAGSAIYTDPVAAMNDLATWCGTPMPADPCLVKIWPGTYNLGASNLVMQDWVDIEGGGTNITILAMTGQVMVPGNVELRNLSIEKQGGAGAAVSINGQARISHAEIRVAPSLDLAGVEIITGDAALNDVRIMARSQGAIKINGDSPTLNDVTVVADAAINATSGILVLGPASPTMTNVHVTAISPGVFSATGVLNDLGATPVMRDMIIEVTAGGSGGVWGVRNDNSASPAMQDITIRCESTGPGAPMRGVANESSVSRLINVSIEASGASNPLDTIGVLNEGGEPELIGVSVEVSSPTGAIGVRNDSADTKIDHSTIVSDDTAIRNMVGGSSFIAYSKLEGAVVGNPGNYTCIGAYDGTYTALTSQCQ